VIVIKYGGHALPQPGSPDPVVQAISKHHLAGNSLVVVHGGGPQIDAELTLHGISRQMIGGYRKTTPEVFAVVQKVLSGQVLRTLVNQFIHFGVNAIGISAADGELMRVSKMLPIVDGQELDIGLVGDIEEVNPAILQLLLEARYLPIVSPISADSTGQGFNLNADIATGAIGGALHADEVIFMTDVAGVYRNYPDASTIITEITADNLRTLQPTFEEGMIPKVKAALSALESGAKRVRIIDGREAGNLSRAFSGIGGTVVWP
jgi:acetylglutamate kinase